MEFFDTHCHLDFEKYDQDRAEVLGRARQAGVTRILIPAVDLNSIDRARKLLTVYPDLLLAVGIHPNSTADWDDSKIEILRDLASSPNVVAIGEIGLDYYWDRAPKEIQRKALESQLALAAELELPVIIHNRETSADLIPILEDWVPTIPESLAHRPGVLHSFSAPQEFAERALTAGFYLGFTGPVTYKKADELRRIATAVPDDRILIETDGPFLSPTPHRGKRNEPAYVTVIAERISTLRQTPLEEFANLTTNNGKRLFGITDKPEYP